MKQRYELYVDGVRVRVIMSAWSIPRIMAYLERMYPDAWEWEVHDSAITFISRDKCSYCLDAEDNHYAYGNKQCPYHSDD